MKGKNLVKTPGELYAPTPGGTVVSADGGCGVCEEIQHRVAQGNVASRGIRHSDGIGCAAGSGKRILCSGSGACSGIGSG